MRIKQNCKKLIGKWKELKEKLPKVQKVVPGKPLKPSYISIEEMKELQRIRERLKEECQEFLSPSERFKIEERIK